MSAASGNINSRLIPKQPLKRVEIPLTKFKDVAVPHYVDLLKKHKANIEKFQQLGEWDKVHREQINATRLIQQLKQLLYDMDVLRSQVEESDLPKFDKLTAIARQDAQNAIEEYLVLIPQSQTPLWIASRSNASSTDNVSEEVKSFPETPPDLVVQLSKSLSKEELTLAKQEECLKSWERLQSEVQDIHQLFEEFSHLVQEQKQDVDQAEVLVEEAAENVTEGTKTLAASAARSTVYPIAGAVIGGCLGGPIGLVAGMKLGGLAALGCGVLGFTGGQILKKKHQAQLSKEGVELANLNQNCNMKGSVSLPQISSKKHDTTVPACKEE